MASSPTSSALRLRKTVHGGRVQLAVDVETVRCVVRYERKYLLVQHRARRRRNLGKWSLPGGRLKGREKPKAGLRRELNEELRLRARALLRLGDWRDKKKYHRIFACEVLRPLDWFNRSEILELGWFTLEEVIALANASRLRRGFELAAIAEFESRLPAQIGRAHV